MTLRKIHLSITLALVGCGISCAQSFPTTPSPGISATPNVAKSFGIGAHAAASQPTAVSSVTSGTYGPFGIGKPRSFPILRHLNEHHATNKAKLRSSPLGKIGKELRKLFSKMTGGVIPAVPAPNHVELAAPGPQGAAAHIQKDVLDAPKRLAAIQQLGTVDCHWYPEALTQLTTSLRTDRSECVRYEAAKILSNCCCCEPQVIQALKICVAGNESDGNPSERSFRVRDQAAIALEGCLALSQEPSAAPPQLIRPEYPDAPSTIPPMLGGLDPALGDVDQQQTESGDGIIQLATYRQSSSDTSTQTLSLVEQTENAREVLRLFREAQERASITPEASRSSLSEIWKKAK